MSAQSFNRRIPLPTLAQNRIEEILEDPLEDQTRTPAQATPSFTFETPQTRVQPRKVAHSVKSWSEMKRMQQGGAAGGGVQRRLNQDFQRTDALGGNAAPNTSTANANNYGTSASVRVSTGGAPLVAGTPYAPRQYANAASGGAAQAYLLSPQSATQFTASADRLFGATGYAPVTGSLLNPSVDAKYHHQQRQAAVVKIVEYLKGKIVQNAFLVTFFVTLFLFACMQVFNTDASVVKNAGSAVQWKNLMPYVQISVQVFAVCVLRSLEFWTFGSQQIFSPRGFFMLHPQRALVWAGSALLNFILVRWLFATLFAQYFAHFNPRLAPLFAFFECTFFLVAKRHYADRGETKYEYFRDKVARVYYFTFVQRDFVVEILALTRAFLAASGAYLVLIVVASLRVPIAGSIVTSLSKVFYQQQVSIASLAGLWFEFTFQGFIPLTLMLITNSLNKNFQIGLSLYCLKDQFINFQFFLFFFLETPEEFARAFKTRFSYQNIYASVQFAVVRYWINNVHNIEYFYPKTPIKNQTLFINNLNQWEATLRFAKNEIQLLKEKSEVLVQKRNIRQYEAPNDRSQQSKIVLQSFSKQALKEYVEQYQKQEKEMEEYMLQCKRVAIITRALVESYTAKDRARIDSTLTRTELTPDPDTITLIKRTSKKVEEVRLTPYFKEQRRLFVELTKFLNDYKYFEDFTNEYLRTPPVNNRVL